MTSDESTLTVGPLQTLTGHSGLPQVPALTIVWHPDIDRIGQIAPLTNLLEVDVAHLSRSEPLFLPPGADSGEPLSHRGISKDSVLDITFERGAFELRRVQEDEVEVDGEPLTGSRRVSAADLARGLILTVARRFVFCLHSVHFPITRSPTLGLLGTSDRIEDVRRSIARAADKTMPILLRGESGTGKELAAHALHESGPRSKARFVAVNMGGLLHERADAALFGYKRGAFTGAVAELPGEFRSAAGGTIFLDEIGYLTPEVQPMLLRVLDTNEVQPLGSSQPMKIDVRIVAATDAKLEKAVAEGRFETPLYNRLNSAFTIKLPPLRQRREDVGILLVHWLKIEFGEGGARILQRLQDPDPKTRPWLSARDVAAVARSPLPANVRSLLGLARNLVGNVGDNPNGDTNAVVTEFLKGESAGTGTSGSPSTPKATPPATEYSQEQLLVALEKADWNRTKAAAHLGVSRQGFWRATVKHPDLRRVADLELPDLILQLEGFGGDLGRLAAKLGVPEQLLARRLNRRKT
jgi:two-component system, NtrC family, nitrogen regulation response regulator GlnG